MMVDGLKVAFKTGVVCVILLLLGKRTAEAQVVMLDPFLTCGSTATFLGKRIN